MFVTITVTPELAGSSPYLQKPAAVAYPEPTESTLHHPANLPKIIFDPILHLRLGLLSGAFLAFPLKPCTLVSPIPCVPHAPPT
jgi:hypothetical protein